MPIALPSPTPFAARHIGPSPADVETMLQRLGLATLDALIDAAVPAAIRTATPLDLPAAADEHAALAELAQLAARNRVARSYLGLGYYDTVVPAVLVRNVLENPGWYTQYTPYQPEISQGRLECLLTFQTMVASLTGMDIANASLLDEATAAAEAMTLVWGQQKRAKVHGFFVADDVHPQTLAVVRTRAEAAGIEVVVGRAATIDFSERPGGIDGWFGALVQTPTTTGRVMEELAAFCARAHAADVLVAVATDLLACVALTPPGELGADVVIGNSQRFGVPLGFGGPHAAFMATRETHKRALPGRIVGQSIDAHGQPALRLALQTREQHIRRDKATSNICTAQVLLAILAGLYACWHGPAGLQAIAWRVHGLAALLQAALRAAGVTVSDKPFFDTLWVELGARADRVRSDADAAGMLLRDLGHGALGIALDETTTLADLADLVRVLTGAPTSVEQLRALAAQASGPDLAALTRTTAVLPHAVFGAYHSETEMMRYLHRLQGRDLSLTTSMIALGSCTMKLNAAAEMLPVTWPGFGRIHPFAPAHHTAGYRQLFADLERWLCAITGFTACSLQPNAGSQGEYAGLLAIRAYHRASGSQGRNVCLIPQSAHGTNPATAVMAGMQVVVVACDAKGNIDIGDLGAKAAEHRDHLAALMVTYPSTHGVFESAIKDICAKIHECGGQVYMDGANLNAQVGLVRPAELGADVCHINLHKTFCIPHGGGGPGMGPICVAAHLAPHLPGHPLVDLGAGEGGGAVSAAPWGSPSILPIPWMYIRMMGPDGLTRATKIAILNANYVARRLAEHFPILYTGQSGFVAHECIVDVRPLKAWGIEVDDIAKRLMDYGFHAPTMSFPVPGTLMVEPTESESLAELDRFCDALASIQAEAVQVRDGVWDKAANPLKRAPHTAADVTGQWPHGYSREVAAFPAPWTRAHKFWPAVGRIDNAYGDRNLVCSCPPPDAYSA
ncbi:MAG: glycine dehydrogenase (aminomethyl-transferring) [Myxococcales bacterium]|nr:glycine dehydrogenase (aminomethyl-transferring) [Myxococcales bacterium]